MTEAVLPTAERRLHRTLLDGLLTTGKLPPEDALVEASGIELDEIPALLTALSEADYLGLDDDGRIVCLYPLSPYPTLHVVEFGGSRRFAMCAIDALGVSAMLGQPVVISGVCAVCRLPIHLDVEPRSVVGAEPQETVVIARRDGDSPAVETCCPFTLFACCEAHGEEFVARVPETSILTLDEALTSGETIFGDLLGEVLPAHRRRAIGIPSRTQS